MGGGAVPRVPQPGPPPPMFVYTFEGAHRRTVRVAHEPLQASAAAAAPDKIRIKLKSFDTALIRQACDDIVGAAGSTGASIAGPVPLPTRRKIYCVLRSPHVNKDSREHFETRTHQRLIDITDLSAQTVDKLMQLDLPAGVDVQVKL
ncbi:unnamed protein product [Pedinophyceae sp. YPF-701]|nr:unnamed protein product [Pedinophyceae sp. YPF-701]